MEEHHRRPVAHVDVGEPQPVHLAVLRLVVEAGQVVEAVIWSSEDVHCQSIQIPRSGDRLAQRLGARAELDAELGGGLRAVHQHGSAKGRDPFEDERASGARGRSRRRRADRGLGHRHRRPPELAGEVGGRDLVGGGEVVNARLALAGDGGGDRRRRRRRGRAGRLQPRRPRRDHDRRPRPRAGWATVPVPKAAVSAVAAAIDRAPLTPAILGWDRGASRPC